MFPQNYFTTTTLSWTILAFIADFFATAHAQTYIAIAVGTRHTCALRDDGKAKCWGANFYGQLGLGDTNHRGDQINEMGDNLPFVDVGSNAVISQLTLGSYSTCALLSTGKVKCWGYNRYGALGLGISDTSWGGAQNQMGDNLPVVDLGDNYKAIKISSGNEHNCALLDDQSVKCWGANFFGQLGKGDTVATGSSARHMGDNLRPVDFGTTLSIADLDAGGYTTCVLTTSGRVKCVGHNEFGSLGTGNQTNYGSTTATTGDNIPFADLGNNIRAKQLSTGALHTCVVTEDHRTKCWGLNFWGNLGLGDTRNRGTSSEDLGNNLPFIHPFGGPWVESIIATTTSHGTCALSVWGTIKCWGLNNGAQLGLGDFRNRGGSRDEMRENLPSVPMPPLSRIEGVAGSAYHTCFLSSGEIRCVGNNTYGQLGYGHTRRLGDSADTVPAVLEAIEL